MASKARTILEEESSTMKTTFEVNFSNDFARFSNNIIFEIIINVIIISFNLYNLLIILYCFLLFTMVTFLKS